MHIYVYYIKKLKIKKQINEFDPYFFKTYHVIIR